MDVLLLYPYGEVLAALTLHCTSSSAFLPATTQH